MAKNNIKPCMHIICLMLVMNDINSQLSFPSRVYRSRIIVTPTLIILTAHESVESSTCVCIYIQLVLLIHQLYSFPFHV